MAVLLGSMVPGATTALVAVSHVAYVVLKVLGAAVLVTLGVQAWRAARKVSGDGLPDVTGAGLVAAGVGLLAEQY